MPELGVTRLNAGTIDSTKTGASTSFTAVAGTTYEIDMSTGSPSADLVITLPTATIGDSVCVVLTGVDTTWGVSFTGTINGISLTAQRLLTVDGSMVEMTYVDASVGWKFGTFSNHQIGWEYHQDNTYTSGSPLAVNNARVQVTNDSAGANTVTTESPYNHSALWSSNKVIADHVGEGLILRVDFTCNPAGVSDYAQLQFDIGTGAPDIVVVDRTVSFQKTGDTLVSTTSALFVGSTFVTNGCKIYLDTSSSGDSIDIFDIGVLVQKVY